MEGEIVAVEEELDGQVPQQLSATTTAEELPKVSSPSKVPPFILLPSAVDVVASTTATATKKTKPKRPPARSSVTTRKQQIPVAVFIPNAVVKLEPEEPLPPIIPPPTPPTSTEQEQTQQQQQQQQDELTTTTTSTAAVDEQQQSPLLSGDVNTDDVNVVVVSDSMVSPSDPTDDSSRNLTSDLVTNTIPSLCQSPSPIVQVDQHEHQQQQPFVNQSQSIQQLQTIQEVQPVPRAQPALLVRQVQQIQPTPQVQQTQPVQSTPPSPQVQPTLQIQQQQQQPSSSQQVSRQQSQQQQITKLNIQTDPSIDLFVYKDLLEILLQPEVPTRQVTFDAYLMSKTCQRIVMDNKAYELYRAIWTLFARHGHDINPNRICDVNAVCYWLYTTFITPNGHRSLQALYEYEMRKATK